MNTKVRVSPTRTRICYFLSFGVLAFIAIEICLGLAGAESLLTVVFFVSVVRIFRSDQEYLVTVNITETCIISRLVLTHRCTVLFSRPVYVVFFQEEIQGVPNEIHHVMVSNLPIPDFAPGTRFATYDRSKQIMFPDTEKTRQAIAPLLSSEFCVLQGDAPPPLEELRKKKEKKQEETPVVKQEKSPDDPPPFTGKWNGRF